MIQTHELLHLNTADYVMISVVVLSTLISLVRGLFKELLSLIIWAVGFWVAIKFYHHFAKVLESHIASVAIRDIASFTIIFLSILILGALINYLFSFIIVKTGLSGTDRLLGMVFGCARGVLLISVILLLISATSFVEDEWWKKSVLIPHLQVVIDWLRHFLPQKMTSIVSSIPISK